MSIELNWITLLLAVIISQSLLAACLLLFSSQNRMSNRILALLILGIALWLADHFMRIAGIYSQLPNLYFLPIFYSFSFGPLIWFYVQSLVNAHFQFKKTAWLHFVPVALQAGLYLMLACSSYHFKYWYWINVHRPYTYRIEFDGTWVSITIYLLLSFRLVRRYQSWVVNNFSEVSRIRLNWLRAILLVLIILCVQWLIEIILRDHFNKYFNYDYSVELLGLFVLVLGVAGLRQSSLSAVVYQPLQPEKSLTVFVTDAGILEKIKTAMEQQRLFLNPTLTLTEFSNAVGINSWLVSRNINTGLEKSFNDFVNHYRVEEVKRRLAKGDLEKFTLLAIAFDSGFNSKTNFNRIFKEQTGISPSAFAGIKT
jgi:AraC-like DNA-binding protein